MPDQQAPTSPATPPRRRSRVVMWIAMLCVAATVALAFAIGPRPAVLFLAGAVGAMAVIRAVSPSPGPYGISTRSRVFDVTVMVIGAVVLAGLAITTPAASFG